MEKKFGLLTKIFNRPLPRHQKVIKVRVRVSANKLDKQKLVEGDFTTLIIYPECLESHINYIYDRPEDDDIQDEVLAGLLENENQPRKAFTVFEDSLVRRSAIQSIILEYDNHFGCYFISIGAMYSTRIDVNSIEEGREIMRTLHEWWMRKDSVITKFVKYFTSL